MKFKQWLIEMPIGDFKLYGDWKPGAPKRGWDSKSIGILTNEKGVEKIRNKWRNTEIDFDMYFVRLPNIQDFSETGEVTPEWVTENLGITLQPNLEAITVIFINNLAYKGISMNCFIRFHSI